MDVESTSMRPPIDVLPVELLVHIFQLTGHWRSLMRIIHVCSHWRTIAISAPPLWTDISLEGREDQERFEFFMQRSQTAPLRIIANSLDDEFLWRLADLLHNEDTIDKIHVSSPSTHGYRIFFEGLFGGQLASNDETMDVRHLLCHTLPLGENFYCESRKNYLSAKRFPNLRSLNSAGGLIEFGTPFTSLVKLTLHNQHLTYEAIEQLAAGAPNVHTLMLPTIAEHTGPRYDPIEMPSVRTFGFSLKSDYGHALECPCPLAILRFPNLEYLEIAASYDFRAHACGHGLLDKTRLPKLRTLRIERLTEDRDLAFPALPLLERLELVEPRSALDMFGHAQTPDLYALPNLKSLYFENTQFEPSHYEWLKEFGKWRHSKQCRMVVELAPLSWSYEDRTQKTRDAVGAFADVHEAIYDGSMEKEVLDITLFEDPSDNGDMIDFDLVEEDWDDGGFDFDEEDFSDEDGYYV
ncbi:hypothetical protein CYLTODRAFT_487643 [Cylindrobasidium torrendii FP15055 ss-10]|uniref:F-box domain-containing protein n=1 Tax=Cylindrobasidium torrendii FP15055 ss-10 TaxID=1314674 RepID=A0A0D7BKD9_9AGAR|nr:hypothetical protein CYLTODRAFT_487643 [Cylindrobasidium torrendii FP15055 ss-10]